MISDDALISVIVPAYNAEGVIGETLASVLAQSHRNIEVLVVDDGSMDATADIVDTIARADTRVRLVRTGNAGVSAARNRAIAESRGSLIAPIDNDDLWHPEKLTRQLQALKTASKRTGLVYCWTSGIDGNGFVTMPIWLRTNVTGNVRQAVAVYNIVGNGSVPLVRRSCLEAVGGYDKTYEPGEDWHLYMKLANVCEFALVPECLTGYRLTDENYSVNNIDALGDAINRMTDWIDKHWPDLPKEALRERHYSINEYMTFMAIRRGMYLRAVRHRARAFAYKPSRIVSRAYIDFWGLLIGHMIGIQRYEWQFWRRSQPFLPK